MGQFQCLPWPSRGRQVKGASIVACPENDIQPGRSTIVDRLHPAQLLHKVLLREVVLHVEVRGSLNAEIHVLDLEGLDIVETDVVMVETCLAVAVLLVGEAHERAHTLRQVIGFMEVLVVDRVD